MKQYLALLAIKALHREKQQRECCGQRVSGKDRDAE